MMGNRKARHSNRGFTLVEVLVAMVIFVFGMVAIATLMIEGIRLQSFSQNSTIGSALVKTRIERLQLLQDSDPQRAVGGSLTADLADHFELPPGSAFVVRWTVAAGPAGTQDVTVAALPLDPNFRVAPVQFRMLLP